MSRLAALLPCAVEGVILAAITTCIKILADDRVVYSAPFCAILQKLVEDVWSHPRCAMGVESFVQQCVHLWVNGDILTALEQAPLLELLAVSAEPDKMIEDALSDRRCSGFLDADRVDEIFLPEHLSGTLGNIALTDVNGDAFDGLDSGLSTTSGQSILLYSDPANDNIVVGRAGGATGAIVFAVYLEPTGGTTPTGARMWTVQYQAIQHPDTGDHDDSVDLTGLVHVTAFESQSFSFANAPSGQNLFMMFGNTSGAILVTGEQPANQSEGANVSSGNTVNSGQGGGTTTLGTDGQQVKAQKALVVTFVTGANPDYIAGPNAGNSPGQPLSATEANVEANIQFDDYFLTQAAEFTISQMNPGGNTTARIRIEAYLTADEPGNDYIDNNPMVQGDTAINITTGSVEVLRGGVNVVGTAGVAVDYGATSAVITGVRSGDVIRYETDVDHNRVLIRNDQPVSGSGSNVSFDLGGFSLTEVAGDTDEIGSKIFFEDDGPSIATGTNPNALTVDETNLAIDASGSFANLFSVNFGTDGAASSGALTYALGIGAGGPNSGLVDTATGNAVFLFVSADGTTITGKAGTSLANAETGPTVFVISVNASTGLVTLDQQRAVVHPIASDPDDAVTLADDVVTLTATAKDGDGDTATKTENVGDRFTFKDDGPSIAAGVNPAALTVDETTLGTDALGSFASLFNVSYGADGPASTGALTYALGIGVASANSGLTDTATGNAVFMFLSPDGTTITGKAGTSLANAETGPTVFVITVNAATGDVTLDQQRAVVHPNASDPDDAVTLPDGAITMTATAKDGDGDTASRTESVGDRFTFKDDGPAVTVDDASGTYAAGAQGVWDPSPGADGFSATNAVNVTFDSYEIDLLGTTTTTATNSTFARTGDYSFAGSITDDFNGDGVNDTVSFTLVFDPVAETYDLQVTAAPGGSVTRDSSQGALKAGGPDPVRTLLFGGSPPSEAGADDVVFFGVVPTAPVSGVPGGNALAEPPQVPNDLLDLVYPGATDLTEDQIQAFLFPTNQIPTLINSSTQMNVSTSGIGINNNNLDGSGAGIQAGDESFVFNPEEEVDSVRVYISNSVGGYNTASEALHYRVYHIDGTVSDLTLVSDGMLNDALRTDPTVPQPAAGGKYFEIDTGKKIDAVQFIMEVGSIKIPVIQWTIDTAVDPEPLRLDFTAALFDGDSDSDTDSFSIDLAESMV
jgi:hypothetical protein